MSNSVIEVKFLDIFDKNTKIVYQKHENSSYTLQVLKLKENSNSEYEMIEFSAITKEAYENCPALPAKQK